jgi:hypothetical protein
MKNNKEFIEMMSGGFGEFTAYEIWVIMTNMSELGINTFSIQQNFDGSYYGKVDEKTVVEYRKNMRRGQI